MSANPLNWNEIVNRIFFVYPRMTQKDIAEKLGVSPDLVSGWKKGRSKPGWDLLEGVVRQGPANFDWILLGTTNDDGLLCKIYLNYYIDPAMIIDKHAFSSAESHIFRAVREMTSLQFLYPKLDYKKKIELANRYLFIAISGKIKIDWRKKEPDKVILSPEYSAIFEEHGYKDFTLAQTIVMGAVKDWRQEKQYAEELSPNYQELLRLTGQSVDPIDDSIDDLGSITALNSLANAHRLLGEIGIAISKQQSDNLLIGDRLEEIQEIAQDILSDLTGI